jgi:hypothetical protein
MSALGQKQTWLFETAMSALPPKANMDECDLDVRFVAKSGLVQCSKVLLFAHLVGAAEQ